PRPSAGAGLLAGFLTLESGHRTALALVNSSFGPTAVELFSESSAVRLNAMSGGAVAPVWPARQERDPLGQAGHWFVAVQLSGLPAAVERQTQEAGALARQMGAKAVTALEREAAEQLFRHLRDYGRDTGSRAAVIVRCAVLPTETARAAQLLGLSLGESGEAVEIAASPGAGIVRGYWRSVPSGLLNLVSTLRRELGHFGGTLVVERCPAEVKSSLDVWGSDDQDLDLMRDMKAALDPDGMLNPGRYLARL
ncbi:MAG: FAD-binding oxidoreductase, partial [Dehalococcoidia bacterium]